MSRPFLALPAPAHWRTFGRLSSLVGALFAVVFVGAECITRLHAWRIRLVLPGEAELPLVPAWTWIYCSVYLPILAAPLVLRSTGELQRLARVLAGVILVAGLGFLLVPAELAYAPAAVPDKGATATLLLWADALNLDHELFPSLHVALSATCLGVFSLRAPPVVQVALWTWAVLVGVSTVLTHQHHVVDVLGGWALAAVAVRRYGSE
jgi:membrane-associated phospholipid phosphatase